MGKGSAFRDLTAGAESLTSAGDSQGHLSVPTLEERARLFLRAIHGERDFTSGEHTKARNTILDAMAADVTAKSNGGMPGEPAGWDPPGPMIAGPHDPVATGAVYSLEDAFVDAARDVRSAYEANYAQHSASRANLAFCPPSTKPELVSETSFSRIQRSTPGGFGDGSFPPFSDVTHKLAKHRVITWSVAVFIFAGLGVLGGFALYRSQPVSVTAESTRGGMSVADTPISTQSNDGSNEIALRRAGADEPVSTQSPLDRRAGAKSLAAVPPVAPSPATSPAASLLPVATPLPDPTARPVARDPRGVAAAPVATTPPPATAQKTTEQSKAGLLERARTVIAAGDIETTRAALSKLTDEGSAWAAVELGKTYDPNILDALGVRDFPSDIEKARAWYQRAQLMGSPEAAGLLESLEPQRTTIPLKKQPVQQRPAAR